MANKRLGGVAGGTPAAGVAAYAQSKDVDWLWA